MLFTFLRIIISALISELLFMGLGIVPNILVLIFSISLMSIVTFMPLTANGLGLKQWIFTVTMGSTGIGISMAGTVALVATAIEYGIILILTLLFGTITEQHDA